MTNGDDAYSVGFRKPPKHTRFAKGTSGNPNGRPKGSQNPATILDKACRERIRIITNGKTRYVSKFEATMLQLNNKAASGDLKAIRELLNWIISLPNFEQAAIPPAIPNESDSLVMASIIKRIRNSEDAPSDTETGPGPNDTPNTEGQE
jgi:hypothetical protein